MKYIISQPKTVLISLFVYIYKNNLKNITWRRQTKGVPNEIIMDAVKFCFLPGQSLWYSRASSVTNTLQNICGLIGKMQA